MPLRTNLVYAALATTLVACFDDGGTDEDVGGTLPDGGVLTDASHAPIERVLPAPSRGGAVAR